MRLLVVNPNTTASMTRKIGAAARAVAAPGTEIIAVNPDFGPESIEGYYDEAFAVPGLIAEMAKAPDVDAVVIACFDDTGLDAARSFARVPVVGIGEAAFHMASLVSARFATVTTTPQSVTPIEQNLVRYGLAARSTRVFAADVRVLDLEEPGSAACGKVSATIGRAIRDHAAEAIVLGCAGMTDLAAALAAEHEVPVIDGVAAAVKLCEGLVALRLKTSKAGTYASPSPKAFAGFLSDFGGR